MVTIHNLVENFRKFRFFENEGLFILGIDEKAVSSYVHFPNKSMLLDALLRIFKKEPELLLVFSDAVKLASVPCKDKKELEPRLQKFLDKIIKDIENFDENA